MSDDYQLGIGDEQDGNMSHIRFKDLTSLGKVCKCVHV